MPSGFEDKLAGTVVAIVAWSAFNAFLLQFHGQTVGKRILGIRIHSIDGRPPSLVNLIVIRYTLVSAASLIPAIGTLLYTLDGLLIFRPDRRCIHDLLAGTVVLEARSAATARPRLPDPSIAD